MQSRPLTIITTRLPPQICGVGTFSWLLDQNWPADRADHRFLVIDPGTNEGSRAPNGDVLAFGNDWRVLDRVLDQVGAVDVLLHYAGRAYHPLGCPRGMAGTLRRWKSKYPDGRLVIFFHELPGRLPLLNRHSWINIWSRSIARTLAVSADLLITNTAEHVQALQKMSGRRDIRLVPVPSNIEPAAHLTTSRIRTEFAIFGLPYGRWRTLEAFDPHIRQWIDANLLTRLHLIGPVDEKFDSRSDALIRSYPNPPVVVRHGELPPEKVSELLGKVLFALTTVDESTWSKSGTFMAFLAHGCSVVSNNKSTVEPLVWNFLPQDVGAVGLDEIQRRTGAARKWYNKNAAWDVVARKISDWIAATRRDV